MLSSYKGSRSADRSLGGEQHGWHREGAGTTGGLDARERVDLDLDGRLADLYGHVNNNLLSSANRQKGSSHRVHDLLPRLFNGGIRHARFLQSPLAYFSSRLVFRNEGCTYILSSTPKHILIVSHASFDDDLGASRNWVVGDAAHEDEAAAVTCV